MRIRDDRAQEEPEINLVPLIDVILVLIIFFVITTTFDTRSMLQLQLPSATGEPVAAQVKALSVLVNADGRYFVDEQEVLRPDIDALKQVAQGVNALRSAERGFLVITHYQRLLDYIEPDFVHVLADGRIVESGDKTLALKLEEQGYAWVTDKDPVLHGASA